MYQKLKKVVLFLFATSIDEVLVLLLALLCGYPLPLAAVQILWINIVTEGTVTVNLIMEHLEGDRRLHLFLSVDLRDQSKHLHRLRALCERHRRDRSSGDLYANAVGARASSCSRSETRAHHQVMMSDNHA